MSVRWFQRGLDAGAVQSAQIHHGPNALLDPPPKPLWRTSARRSNSPLIYILFGAAMLVAALTVRSDLKGGGPGALLMDKLLRALREHGTQRMVATVLSENDRVRSIAPDLAPATATPPP